MAEYKAHRFFARKQTLLVFHDQVISVDIVGIRRPASDLAIHKATAALLALVDGEISRMRLVGIRLFQELKILRALQQILLHRLADGIVFFFEHPGVNAHLVRSVVIAILLDLVNEEQRKHLDTLAEKRTFTLKMRNNRFANLNAAQLILVHHADAVASINLLAVRESHRRIIAVHFGNSIAILVFFETTRLFVKIKTLRDTGLFLEQAALALAIKFKSRDRSLIRKYLNAFQVQVALGRRRTAHRNALDANLLDQVLVVGIHRIEAVNHVVDGVLAVRRRIAQRQQRLEFRKALFRFLALDTLRLIDNQNRVRARNNVYRAAAAKLVQLHANTARVLARGVERLRVNNHHVDVAVRREMVNLGQVLRIVDKEPDGLAVFFQKMFLHNLERLIDTLANGDARNHHDKLGPAIGTVQLVHRLDVGIGLARTRFHFDGQVVMTFQLIGLRQKIRRLHRLQVRKHLGITQFRHQTLVAKTGHAPLRRHTATKELGRTRIHQVARFQVGLPRKNIANGLRGICLELLVLELDFHSVKLSFFKGDVFNPSFLLIS